MYYIMLDNWTYETVEYLSDVNEWLCDRVYTNKDCAKEEFLTWLIEDCNIEINDMLGYEYYFERYFDVFFDRILYSIIANALNKLFDNGETEIFGFTIYDKENFERYNR